MLTLREPIQLHISDTMCTMTDAFYERIAGSYGAMQADITPKKLLFCLSTPLELPEEFGGMTTVAVSNNFSDRRTVTMELISNVLNRIMLSTTPQFTYQDQVYIDTVLYKLGVENVPLFMRQVQKLTDEHLSVERLLALYREELAQRAAAPLPGESAAPKTSELAAAAETPSDRPRYFLQNEIYDRLQTHELYRLVNRLQTDQTHSVSAFHQNELRTAEQLSVSRLLELSELRERVTAVPRVELHHTVNRFELGDLLPAPQTAEQVLTQAAEAALLSSVEHIYTQSLADRIERAPIWLRLERSLSETVESSVNRFQSFHSEDSFFFTDSVRAPAGLERFREESSVLRELVSSHTLLRGAEELSRRLQETVAPTPLTLQTAPIEAQGEIVGEHETERVEKETERRSERDISSLTREILEHGAAPAPAPPAPAAPAAEPVDRTFRTVREIELTDEVERHTERLRETLERQRRESVETRTLAAAPPEGPETVSETLRELRERAEQTNTRLHTETIREPALQNPPSAPPARAEEETRPASPEPPAPGAEKSAAPAGTQAVSETLRELRERAEQTNTQIQTETQRETVLQNPPSALLERAEEAPYPGAPERAAPAEPAKPGGESPVPGGESAAQTLARELREVNERNREHFEALQVEHLHTVEQQPVPDRQKTLEMSKRALESPQELLRELRESAEQRKSAETIPEEVQRTLERADPMTRAVLEAAMRRESGQTADSGGPQFRETNPGEFNAASLESLRAAAAAPESVFPAVEKTLAEERAQTLIERIAEPAAVAAVSQFVPTPPARLNLIHRREQELLSDELLERLENRQTSQNVEVTNLETQTDRRIEEFTKTGTTTHITAETREDITELVNRTLSRQMGEISDKVYRQMEKRLETERSRRGRF